MIRGLNDSFLIIRKFLCRAIVPLLLVLFAVSIASSIYPHSASAKDIDIIMIAKPHSALDQRHIYNNLVLTMALEKTVPSFGAYDLQETLSNLQRDRALHELIKGECINVHIVPTQQEWENKTIPIRIQLLKGLLSYRLFLIRKDDAEKFSKITSLDQLKRMKAGLRQQWSTTKALNLLGFQVVTGNKYEGLFRMLMSGRFDYFPRGVNEIFDEYDSHQSLYPDIGIEQLLALYLPMPTYVFVSPQHPHLAKRIEAGLKIMISDGSLDALFWKYHGENIKRAHLSKRRIFTVDNPLLRVQPPVVQLGDIGK